jgi:dethiobiotin synthetase
MTNDNLQICNDHFLSSVTSVSSVVKTFVCMAKGLFITGTGTGVGKTYVSSLLARRLREAGIRVGVYKPVASGCDDRNGTLVSADADSLWAAAGRIGSIDRVCPQMFHAPLAPHLAARAEGRRVDAKLLREGLVYWLETSEIVLVEGAGGLMSPISDDDYNADLAAEFGFPLLVVAANQLGVINATLQTLITAATYCDGLDVAGIVLSSTTPSENDASIASNADEIARRCVPPLLATVEHGGGLECDAAWAKLCTPRRSN